MAANALPTVRMSSRVALLASSVLGGVLPGVAFAGPEGGSVAAGSASIASSGSTTTITQTSSRAVLVWPEFSVGAGEAVVFNQPDAKSATLNRVTGSTASTIAGSITSNGAVYLVNPNGIAITASGNVQTAGGFVASTLDIADDDFMAGKLEFTGKGASKGVSNAGSISAGAGAYVALLGGQVANSGTISVPLGKVGLGSGESVALDLNGGNFLQVAVPSSVLGDGALVDNSGEIVVRGGRVQIKAAVLKDAVRNVVNMSGSINADSAVGDGGSIELIGGADTASMAGAVNVTGTLSAQATGASGNGGFIETSGANINLAGATINAGSASGKAGTWLIDPTDLVIDDEAALTISAALMNANVTVQTTENGATGPGITDNFGAGDIIINSDIAWESDNSLTFSAYRDVVLQGGIFNPIGTASLVLRADNTGTGLGTVIGQAPVLMGGQNATATIYYNPASFGTADTFNNIVAGSLTAYQLVNNVTNLQAIGAYAGDNDYALGRDIDASETIGWNEGQGFVPIGQGSFTAFTGLFEGLGHTISGLTVNRNNSLQALFFSIGAGGVVRNLNLRNVSISGGPGAAGVAGSLSGTVSGVSVTGQITSSSSLSGGVIGRMNPTGALSNSWSAANVSAVGSNVGGVIGAMLGGSVSRSFATGNVTTVGNNAGGVVGTVAGGTVSDVYSTGAVQGGAGVGGVVGAIGNATVTNVLATGNVSGVSSVGGVAGSVIGTLTNGFYDSSIVTDYPGVGSGDGSGATGLSTARLQDGTLPSGFTDTIWAAQSGSYPTLIGVTPPPPPPPPSNSISGTVYSDYGRTALSGARVVGVMLSGGSSFGNTTSSDGGYYSLSAPTMNGDIMLFLDAGGVYANTVTRYSGSSLTGVNLYGGYLNFYNFNSTLSSALDALGGFTNSGYSSNNFLFTVSGGTATPTSGLALTGYVDFEFDRDVDLGSNALVIEATGAVNQASTRQIGAGDIVVMGGAFDLVGQNLANSLATKGVIGSVSFRNNQSLTLGIMNASGRIDVRASSLATSGVGAIRSEATGNGAVFLAGENGFNNAYGPGAIETPNGTWQIYTGNPSLLNDAGLDSGNQAIWGWASSSGVAAVSGNRYLFGLNPVLTVSGATSATKTYGADAGAQLAAMTPVITGVQAGRAGAYLGDTLGDAVTGPISFVSKGAAASANAGTYAIAFAGSAANGYLISETYGTLTVNPAALSITYTADKVRRTQGSANPAFTGSYTVDGLVNSDLAGNIIGGTAQFSSTADASSPVGQYAITGSGLSSTSGNYTLAASQAADNATALTVYTPNTVSGTVFRDLGQTTFAGANVVQVLVNGGRQISTATSNGVGAYSLAAPDVSGSVLLYLTGGGVVANTVFNYTAGTDVSGINLYGGYLQLYGLASTLTGALGGFAGWDGTGIASREILFTATGGVATPTAGLALATRGNFTLDTSLDLGNNALAITGPSGSVRQTAGATIKAGLLSLDGANQTYVFNQPNQIETVIGTTASLLLLNSSSLNVSAQTSTGQTALRATRGNITLTAVDNLLISSAIVGSSEGAITLTGGTVKSNATLSAAEVTLNGTTDISGSGAINASSLISLNTGSNAANGRLSGVISGEAGLAFSGSGTVTLTGANTYSGGTTVSSGTLQISPQSSASVANQLGTGDVYIGRNARLTVSNNLVSTEGQYAIANRLTGPGSVIFTGGTSSLTSLTADNSYTGGTSILSSIVQATNYDSALGTGTIAISGGGLRGGARGRTFANNFQLRNGIGLGAGVNITGNIFIAGPTIITPAGGIGGSTWSGQVSVGGPLAFINSGDPLGGTWTSGSPLTISGPMIGAGGLQVDVGPGMIRLTGDNSGLTSDIQLISGTLRTGATDALGRGPTVDIGATGVLDLGGFSQTVGALSGSGTVLNSGSSAVTLTNGTRGYNTTFSGTIKDGNGALSLVQTGGAKLTLTGANSYSGGTKIDRARLAISPKDSTSIGNQLGTGDVLISDYGQLIIENRSVMADNQYVIANRLTGVGSVQFLGPENAITVISGDNSYSGGTSIEGSVVQASGYDTALGTGTVSMLSGALRAGATARTFANAFTIRGSVGFGGSINITGDVSVDSASVVWAAGGSGDSTWSGALKLNSSLLFSSYGSNALGTRWGVGQKLSVTGNVIGGGPLLIDVDKGLVRLSGANDFRGGSIQVFSGTLQTGANGALGGLARLQVDRAGTLDLAGYAVPVGALTGTGTVTNSASAGATLIHGSQNLDTAFSGTVQDGVGTVSLVQTGTAKLQLSGTNTYTGTTTVQSGTLEFGRRVSLYSGNTAGWTDSQIIVNPGATLSLVANNLDGFNTLDVAQIGALGTATGGLRDGAFLGINVIGEPFAFSGTLGNTNGGANKIGLVKSGGGTLLLTNSLGVGRFNIDQGVVDLSGNWNVGSGDIVVRVRNGVLQGVGTITANSLAITGGASIVNLTGANAVGSLSAVDTQASISFSNRGSITLGSMSANAVTVRAIGMTADLTLAPGSVFSGNYVRVAADRNFINNAGPGAMAAATNWTVFASNPATSVFGGLNSFDTALWNATFDSTGGLPSQGRSRYVFAYQPILTFSTTPLSPKTYGTNGAAALASATSTVTGFSPGIAGVFLADTAASIIASGPSFTSAGTGVLAGVGDYAINVFASLARGYGYNSTAANRYFVSPAPLTVTYTADAAAMTYGSTVPTLTGSYVASGLVNGDTLGGNATFTTAATSRSNVGTYAIAGGGLTNRNYAITEVQAAGNATALTINPALLTLTYTADTASRAYGAANPLFTGSYSTTGLVNGDTNAGVLSGTAAFTSTADANSNVGKYAITGDGLAANGNYKLKVLQAAGNATALTINPAVLSITYTAAAAERAYGAANPVLGGTYAVSGLVNGQTEADIVSGSAAFTTTANATSNVGKYAVTGGGLASGSTNYTVQTLQAAGNDTALTINPAALTVTYFADGASRKYGEANPALTGRFDVTGLVNGDTLAGTAAFSTDATVRSDIGSYAITGSGLSASSNYKLTANQAAGNATALEITPADLVITYTANEVGRLYGNSYSTFSGYFGTQGLVNGDTVTGTAVFSSPTDETTPVGRYGIFGSGLTASRNYRVIEEQASRNFTALIIDPAPLTVTYTADATSRTYGSANPDLTGNISVTGLKNADTAGSVLSGTATFTTDATTTSGVGSYGVFGSGLGSNGNYVLTSLQAAGNATALTINPAALMITYIADPASRTYGDVNPDFSGKVTVDGLLNGDELTGSALFASDANAASHVGFYAINGSGLLASKNYTVTVAQAETNGSALFISPAKLLVTYLADPARRTYGAENPVFTGSYEVEGLVNGDGVGGSALFTSEATPRDGVGSYGIYGRGITASSDYVVFEQQSKRNAFALTIDPATLTVTYQADSQARKYGEENPEFTGLYSIEGFVNGETEADVITGKATFTSEATRSSGVGSYLISGGGLFSNDNYKLIAVQDEDNPTALTINPATLRVTYTADSARRVYGSANPTFSGTYALDGLVNGDSEAAVLGGKASFASKTTEASDVDVYPLIGFGLTSLTPNYEIEAVQAANNATALTITPAALTVTYTANAARRSYGEENPELTGSYVVSGLLNGASASDVTDGVALFTTSATAASNVGRYAVNGSGIISTSRNYTVSEVQAGSNAFALVVNPAVLTLTYVANAVSRTYGTNNPALTGNANLTGLVNGDTLATVMAGTARFTSTANTLSDVGNYAITGSGLTLNSRNYVLGGTFQDDGNASALRVNPAVLNVVYTASAASRTYGQDNPALSGTYAVSGMRNGQSAAALTGGTATFSTTATSTSNAGKYAVNGTGIFSTSRNYVVNDVQFFTNATALVVNPAVLTITYTANPASRVYGAGNPTLGGTFAVDGLVNGDQASAVLGSIARFTTTANALSDVGSYGITGGGLISASRNYTIGTAVQAASNATALTVTPATLTVTYTAAAASRNYGQANPTLTGTYAVTGMRNGQAAADVTTGVAVFSSTADATSGVGRYAVTGTGVTSSSRNYVVSEAQFFANAAALVVNPAVLTITYTANPASRAYGANNPTLGGTYTVDGLVNGDQAATVLGSIARFTTTANALSDVGSYGITGSGLISASRNYTVGRTVQAAGNATALTVTPATLTVTYTATAASRNYGQANPALTGTYAVTGLRNGQAAADVTTGVAVFSTTADVTTGVGRYAITGTGVTSSSRNYVVSDVQSTANRTALLINPAVLTVTYTANPVKRVVGAANPALTGTFTVDGLVNGDVAANSVSSAQRYTTTASTASPVGAYAVTGSGIVSTSRNYVIGSSVQADGNATALTVTPKP